MLPQGQGGCSLHVLVCQMSHGSPRVERALTGAADTIWEGGPEASEQMRKAIITGKANLESL